MSYRFLEPYCKNKKTESAAFFRTHKMSLGRWTRERGKEAEEEGDQHGLKGDEQFDDCQGGENKENQESGEKQVISLYEMR